MADKKSTEDNRRFTLWLIGTAVLHLCFLMHIQKHHDSLSKIMITPLQPLSISVTTENFSSEVFEKKFPLSTQKTSLFQVKEQLEKLSDHIATVQKNWEEIKIMSHRENIDKDNEAGRYLAKWQSIIEQNGNEHYPIEAKNNNIQGDVHLAVRLKSDGHIDHIQIRKSSGYYLLDRAAIESIKQASPFEAFPENVSQKYPYLDIIRVWQFRGGHIETHSVS